MNYRQILLSCMGLLLISGIFWPSLKVKASGAEGNTAGVEDEAFHIGGGCSSLAYLGVDQLRDTIRQAFSDDRHSFCFPEEPSECSDYTSLLQGLGRLSTGEDGYHCNLQVQP